uniref:Dehydrogenase/reductase SDR family member 7 n=1 Tax=Stomoxys calcitrans TaxID=35570 RepID=A0A1I8Q9B6_STOCA
MSFLDYVLLAVVSLYIIYVLLWMLLDCNVRLWWKIYCGTSISALKGQVVWITGASSGIGRALALQLASYGVHLVISARRENLLQQLKQQCVVESKGLLTDRDVLVLPMDVLKLEDHKKCLDAVLVHFGHINVLVNNAGRSQRAHWEDIMIEVDRELFELDVFSALHLSRLVVRYFMEKQNGRGQIACTSSVASLAIVPYSASYCGAKHSLNAYFRCLALEHRSVDVTIFNPGPVATEFLRESFTAVPNEKVSRDTMDKHRMSTERVGFLYATALANKIQMSWCGLFPVNLLCYVSRYSLLTAVMNKLITTQRMQKFRDGEV